MTGDAVPRQVRVLTLASILFISGLAGHVAAGGLTPTRPALVLLFVLTVGVATPFVGARISPALVMVLLVGGQGLLHTGLQMLGGSTLDRTNHSCGADASAAMSAHHMAHLAPAASHDWACSLAGGSQVVMLLGHVAAGFVVGAWLIAGERALWTLLAFTVRPAVHAWRSVTALASRVMGVADMRVPRSQPGWVPRYSIRSSLWAGTVVSRRGPPRCCLA
jgi:hypothetical protein